MAAENPILRQWLLLKTLGARQLGVTVQELAVEFDVSIKTVRRDLIGLQRIGFPLQEISVDHQGRKSWRVDAKWQQGLPFTLEEVLALHLGRRALDPLAGTAIWSAAQRAHQKLQAMFSHSALKYLEKLSGAILRTTAGSSDYSGQSAILDVLLDAIEERRATFITYQSAQATEPVTYDVYPYGLIFHRGSLYLVGFAPRHDAIRKWKVNRVEEAETTEIRFRRPENFDLAAYMEKSFGVLHGDDDVQVQIRFAAEVARYVRESRWHGSQRLTAQRDRSLLAEFRVSDTREIKSWVLSFGRHAEILAPQTLREEVAADLTAMLEKYGSGSSQAVSSHPPESNGRPRTANPAAAKGNRAR